MKLLSKQIVIFIGICIAATTVYAKDVNSLRGSHPIEANSKKPVAKKWHSDQAPIKREFVHQPPLVPHKIEGYVINTNSNKCLSCHSWANYKDKGATKISLTHFTDRDGNDLANVSARRYFCTQCHVPQVDSKPLVKNTFKPVKSIMGK
ncbi:MAG: nitrate reductase cytochrome c-type subunit [Gammaproteobacteria bacterium]|nr:nitrate reductase cytochrome c-type subunit [Gammaproteobacteria bacterium]MDH5776634.1 nitrate reductase cytochrome c-type subunit [Gammaproteobacteria bacterium]